MALFLDNGTLVYTFNLADQRVKITTEEKYSDGAWHDVSSRCQYVWMYAQAGACLVMSRKYAQRQRSLFPC